jgi:hypothetical protein
MVHCGILSCHKNDFDIKFHQQIKVVNKDKCICDWTNPNAYSFLKLDFKVGIRESVAMIAAMTEYYLHPLLYQFMPKYSRFLRLIYIYIYI